MARPIVVWPNKILSQPTKPVTEFGPALDALLAEMEEAMHEAEGIGIAANQIGVGLRVAWVGRGDGTFFEIVNPTILSRERPVGLSEGCLSVPGENEVCPRHEKVRVKYQDRAGAWYELEAEGRVAHVLQHEIDHLDGRVYVDHLSGLKRSLIRDRMKKLQRLHEQHEDE